jgi:cyclopropane fatty-acyl-phospholipid synthase-like methyltransferase
MTFSFDGGYDSGYRGASCFWGIAPGSIVKRLLSERPPSSFPRVLDLGCGEGKNSVPFAEAGCRVDAVDCSPHALYNGKKAFRGKSITWIEADALRYEIHVGDYDLIIAYGLFHCLRSQSTIKLLAQRMIAGTRPGGFNIVCTFNDRSHDLRAHPGFQPTLLAHEWYVALYQEWEIVDVSDADLHETHPHNGIQHHHSLTRILARRPRGS